MFELPAKRRITAAGVFSFLTQLVLATFGAMLVGTAIPALIALAIAPITRAPNQALVDSIVKQPLFKFGADNPYFAGPIVTAILLGWFSRRFFRSRMAAVVWVLPSLLLLWNVVTWKSYSPLSHWLDVRANFFTSDCGDSDCLYELLVTAPFYTSLAYSFGWVIRASTGAPAGVEYRPAADKDRNHPN
jgi:hypothetical protein